MLLTSKPLSAQPFLRLVQTGLMVWAMTMAGPVVAQGVSGGVEPAPPVALTHEEGLALAKSRACLGCHQVDHKRVGPSFTAIAQRYSGQDNAIGYMVQVIRKGGRGQWGAVPMPGQAVTEQDAQKLAQWIISIRK